MCMKSHPVFVLHGKLQIANFLEALSYHQHMYILHNDAETRYAQLHILSVYRDI